MIIGIINILDRGRHKGNKQITSMFRTCDIRVKGNCTGVQGQGFGGARSLGGEGEY